MGVENTTLQLQVEVIVFYMSEVIIYPTETVYAIGVNPFDRTAWQTLCTLKGRAGDQTASWLVPSIEEIDFYAEVTPEARRLMEEHMPGPLTMVLKAKSHVPRAIQALDGTLSFRVSSDPIAAELIREYMQTHDVPLTCTSANVHGQPTMGTAQDIAAQFGDKMQLVTEIIDGGPRMGRPSTIVRCVGETVSVLRQGSIKIPLHQSPISISLDNVSASWR